MEHDGHKRFRRSIVAVFFAVIMLFCARFPAPASPAEEQEVFHYLLDYLDINPAAACGIMGNIKAESDFISGILGLGGGYGLCQWTGPRRTRLRNWCASNGKDSSSAKAQIEFTLYELKNYYPQIYSYMSSVPNTAEGAYSAGYYWCMHFEIPANRYSASSYRASLAKNTYWQQYGVSMPYLHASSSPDGITLKWNAGNSAFVVKRAKSMDGKYKTLATLKKGEGTYTDEKAKKSQRYYYYVVRLNGKTEGTRSNKVGATNHRTLEDEECEIILREKTVVYTGKAVRPKLRIKYDGQKLKEGRDFRISYAGDNINAGKVKMTLQGIGRYTGSVKKSYRILKAEAKIRAKDCEQVYEENASFAPNVKLRNCKEGSLKLYSSDRKVVKVSGDQLIIKGTGVCKVKAKLTGTKNYEAEKVSFTVTILPEKVKLESARRNGEEVLVKWTALKKCSGYQIQYDSRTLTEDSPVVEVKHRRKSSALIPAVFTRTQPGEDADAPAGETAQADPVEKTASGDNTAEGEDTAAGEDAAAGEDISSGSTAARAEESVRYVRVRAYTITRKGEMIFGEWSKRRKVR